MDRVNRKEIKKKRVMFVSSTGGHLNELLQLSPLFEKYDYSLITEKTKANLSLKKKYQHVSFLLFGSKDHKLTYPFKLLINCFIIFFFIINTSILIKDKLEQHKHLNYKYYRHVL